MPTFLYTKVNGRLVPSIRHQPKTDGHGKNVDSDVVFSVELAKLKPLDELIKMYPYQTKEE